jgi:hypothetical protein
LTVGALAVLAGVVLLGWQTGRWQRSAAGAVSPDEAVRSLAIAADRRSTGEALLYAGAAIVLATVGALAGSLDDRTGAFFVVTTTTVAAFGILVRAYLHRVRHPIPAAPRRAARPLPTVSEAAAVASAPLADTLLIEADPAEDVDTAMEAIDIAAESAVAELDEAPGEEHDAEPALPTASDETVGEELIPDEGEEPAPDNQKAMG